MTGHDAAASKCPLCSSPASFSLMKAGCAYFECRECEFLFHRPARNETAGSAQDFYDDAYWEMERGEAARREKEDCYLRALELLYLSAVPVANLLDFGCGLGITVRMLRESLGLNAVGVDISADFVETDYLHRCDLTTLSTRYPPAYFDAIYSIEVFEHLEDPRQVLSSLSTLLKPDGKILINTGTREFLKQSDPELNYIDPLRRGHISIYSLKSLQELASAVGRTAEFLGDRKYEVIMNPKCGEGGTPQRDNIERLRLLGEWFPSLFKEYMRLIWVEREFEARGVWALQLSQMVERLSAKRSNSLPQNRS